MANVSYAMTLFDPLGLTVNVNKSVLVPTHEVEFLGIILNSVSMTAILPFRKKERIKKQGLLLLGGEVTLLALASFIGLAVASAPAVSLASLRYKYLEIIRNNGLSRSFGDYTSTVLLDAHSKELVTWWIHNVDSLSKSLLSCPSSF